MTFTECQNKQKRKVSIMKRMIAAIMLFCVSVAFASCGNEKDSSVKYENVVFDSLKTFTEISEVPLNNTIEQNTYETTFCYVAFENANQKINAYKSYLLESGYKMISEIDDDEIVFEANEKKITISFESGESGTNINITIPCDEATNIARRDAKYNELLAAAEEKDFSKVYEITELFSSEEIKGYKEVSAYRVFSLAIKAYKSKVYGEAAECFNDYLEKQPEDKLGAKEYIQECNNILSRYNGTYSGKSFNGLLLYYMFIKDGKVGFESSYADLGLDLGYQHGDSVYYLYDLKVEEYDGTVLLKVADYSFGDIEYKYDLCMLDNGNILVNKFGWDVLKGYYNDTSPFAGEYKRVTKDAPPEK